MIRIWFVHCNSWLISTASPYTGIIGNGIVMRTGGNAKLSEINTKVVQWRVAMMPRGERQSWQPTSKNFATRRLAWTLSLTTLTRQIHWLLAWWKTWNQCVGQHFTWTYHLHLVSSLTALPSSKSTYYLLHFKNLDSLHLPTFPFKMQQKPQTSKVRYSQCSQWK